MAAALGGTSTATSATLSEPKLISAVGGPADAQEISNTDRRMLRWFQLDEEGSDADKAEGMKSNWAVNFVKDAADVIGGPGTGTSIYYKGILADQAMRGDFQGMITTIAEIDDPVVMKSVMDTAVDSLQTFLPGFTLTMTLRFFKELLLKSNLPPDQKVALELALNQSLKDATGNPSA